MKKIAIILLEIAVFIYTRTECFDLHIEGSDNDGRIFAQTGQNIALVCIYSGLSLNRVVFEWFTPSFPREPAHSSAKTDIYWESEVNKKKFILLVKSVSTDDSGIYTCRMGRQDGYQFIEMARTEVEVVVERSIISTDCPSEQWIPTGPKNRRKAAFIQCIIQALPPPIIHWRFQGKEISTGTRFITSVTGLKILDPSETDAGIYTVIARQPKHTAMFSIQVKIFSPPRIVYGPVILGPFKGAVVSGYEAYIQCLATGYPPPSVRWYRLNDPQTELQLLDPQKYFVNSNNQVGTLRIARAQYPDDSDAYICRALVSVPAIYDRWSDDISDEAKIVVNVTLSPSLIPLTTMHQFVDRGDTVTVQCKVRATDPLELYYEKLYSNKSYLIGVQPDDSRISVRMELDREDRLNHNLYLTIKNTNHNDTWNYTCHAHNEGLRQWWNTTIQVMEVPQMFSHEDLPSTDERSMLRFGWRYNATNLTCASYGMPHPTWTWYRRGEQILNAVNDTFTIISWDHWNWSQSWLQVRPCRHTEHFIYDEYVCKATNVKGTNQSQIRFVRASVPGQPNLISYIATQSTLDLNVSQPKHTGGLPILAYELYYMAFGGPGRWYGPVTFPLDASQNKGQPHFHLHGLVASTSYQFKLSAKSIVAPGTPLEFTIRMAESTRPGPVELIHRSYSTDPYSHVLQWKTPLNGGLPLTGYRIRLRRVQLQTSAINLKHPKIQEEGEWQQIIPEFNNPYLNSYRLTNLYPDQVYQVIVEATNPLGRSLDGVNINEYGFLNRTPSYRPIVYPVPSAAVYPHDLVPIWFLFRTPVGDDFGPPPRIFGKSPIPIHFCIYTFLISCLLTVINYFLII